MCSSRANFSTARHPVSECSMSAAVCSSKNSSSSSARRKSFAQRRRSRPNQPCLRNVHPLGAGVGDDALEPVAVRHQPFPRRPAELRGWQRARLLDFRTTHADPHAQILQYLPVRPAAAMRMVGDHLLAARLDDAHARLPVGAIGRHLELEDGIALAGVQAVLQHEHARAALGQRLVEPAAAAREVVHRAVHARHDAHGSNSVLST